MTGNGFYLIMVLGFPLVMLLVAMVAGLSNHGKDERLLDWKLTRSPRREAELMSNETGQMLDALNRYRRLRGLPERSLEDVTRHGWGSLDYHDDPR
jgi:hypothetical protein